nr:membrane protein insertion efficiency factor YidD [Candidatus Levybacteria bacterium]
MKKILIKTIEVYQVIFSVFMKNMLGVKNVCRFETTCSNYAKQSIYEKGVIKGGCLSFVRILKCQPFYKGK